MVTRVDCCVDMMLLTPYCMLYAIIMHAFPIPDKDSCNGDSGGPLFGRDTLDSPMYAIGIVSSGTKICGLGQPGVYTKVAVFEDWIKSLLKP